MSAGGGSCRVIGDWEGPRMSERNAVVRSLHDLGLAMWFGGSLAGAVGFNGAAADVPDEKLRLRVANAAWARWTPVNLAGIAAHLVGGAGLLYANKGRVAAQQGVAASTVAKAALTGVALGVTAYSRVLGKKLDADGEPVEGGTDPSAVTSPDIAKVQRRLKLCQWAVPALTGGIVVLNAVHGEQQRPQQQLPGILATPARLLGLAGTARSARRPALSAVGLRSGPGGPGVRAALASAAPGWISGLGARERPRPRRVFGERLAPTALVRRALPLSGQGPGATRRHGDAPLPAPPPPTVTTTDSSNDEPTTEGGSNGHPVEVQSEVPSA
jgi:hypothetical protein